MNSATKVGIKLEVIRDLIEHVNSTIDQATIEWMREYTDECFRSLASGIDAKKFKKSIDILRIELKEYLPDPITGLFMVSVVTHIIQDLEGTKNFAMLEPLLDACYNIEGKEDDSLLCRKNAEYFAEKVYSVVD